MNKTVRIIGIISKSMYWLSMLAAAVAVFVFLFTPERQLSYAFGLLSFVSMGTSSVLLYGQNLINVGKEVTAPPSEKNAKSKKKSKNTA